MEKSIENIWSQGFEGNEQIIVPKVVDLYNRKSQLLIDKLMRTIKMDLYSIIPVSIGFGLWAYFHDSLEMTIFMVILLGIAFSLSLWQYKKVKSLDTSLDSYSYLITFRNTLQQMISFFTRFFVFGYPFLAFPVFWFMFKDEPWVGDLLAQSWQTIAIGGLIAFFILAATGLFGYKLAVYVVYGKMFSRLKEIIADMEELKG